MQATVVNNSNQSNKPIWYFILCWTILNALQAYTLELHADEAYYWMFSQKLDWGYFYHPPMVALFIKIGDTILQNELGLRLMTILSNSLGIYLLWLIVKKYNASAKWFILLVSGVLVFHVYGFTSTPDAPLFFFAVLFLYFYQKYLERDSWLTAFIIGVVVACLFYSKYHGVLLVGFTLLSNLKLFTRKSFYLALITGIAVYMPHILWQMHRDFPAVNYQLFERSSAFGYHLSISTTFIVGQLLLGGALVSWFLFYNAFTTKITDGFMRALLFSTVGIFGFFLLNTLKVNVQPHYTLVAFVPLICLVLINFQRKAFNARWFYGLAVANIALILVLRFSLILGLPFVKKAEALKSYFGFREWANLVHQKAGDAFVIMDDGFQNPSKYSYYTRSMKGFAYDSRYYGRTMFDIWPMEDDMQLQRTYYLVKRPIKDLTTDTIKCAAGTWYGGWIQNTRTYQKVAITTNQTEMKVKPGQSLEFDLSITNPYPFPVSFTNNYYKHPVSLEACFFVHVTPVSVQPADSTFHNIELGSGQSARYLMDITAPKQKGVYDLFFSIRTEPFSGSKNSGIIKFTVE